MASAPRGRSIPTSATCRSCSALPGGAPPANPRRDAAEARPARWTPRGAVVARLLRKDSTTYRITLGGRTLARGTAAPNEEVVMRAAPPERGWVAGTVELEPDELPGDNVRHFAVWIGPPPAVSRVAPAPGRSCKSAIDVLKREQRVVDGHDIAIVAGDELTSLPALIIAPSDPVRLGAANRALERAGVPWRFGVAVAARRTSRRTPVRRATADSRPALCRRHGDHALRSRRADRRRRRHARARRPRRRGSSPVRGTSIVASPLDPDATTFPVRATFVPWLGGDAHRTTRRRARGGDRRRARASSCRVRAGPTRSKTSDGTAYAARRRRSTRRRTPAPISSTRGGPPRRRARRQSGSRASRCSIATRADDLGRAHPCAPGHSRRADRAAAGEPVVPRRGAPVARRAGPARRLSRCSSSKDCSSELDGEPRSPPNGTGGSAWLSPHCSTRSSACRRSRACSTRCPRLASAATIGGLPGSADASRRSRRWRGG